MLLKNNELNYAVECINNSLSKNPPTALILKLTKMRKIINKELEIYNEAREGTIKLYAKKDDKGELIPKKNKEGETLKDQGGNQIPSFDDAEQSLCIKTLIELSKIEVDIEVEPIKLIEFKVKAKDGTEEEKIGDGVEFSYLLEKELVVE